MVSGGTDRRSGRNHPAGSRARGIGGGITGGAHRIRGMSSRIRSGTRCRRRIRGPLRWTTSRLRVDFNGDLYVADTEDQGIGLDPSMLCPESEPQVSDGDVPDSKVKGIEVPETPEKDWPAGGKMKAAAGIQDVASADKKPASHRRLGNSMIHEWRRALFSGDTLGSNQLGIEQGEDDQAMESVKNKVTAAQQMSISDAETDDETGALAPLADPAAMEDVEAPEPLAEPSAVEETAGPAPLEEPHAAELVPREFILSMLEVLLPSYFY